MKNGLLSCYLWCHVLLPSQPIKSPDFTKKYLSEELLKIEGADINSSFNNQKRKQNVGGGGMASTPAPLLVHPRVKCEVPEVTVVDKTSHLTWVKCINFINLICYLMRWQDFKISFPEWILIYLFFWSLLLRWIDILCVSISCLNGSAGIFFWG